MNRDHRASLGQETVRLLAEGAYTLPDGRRIDLRTATEACVRSTRLWVPAALDEVERNVRPGTAMAAIEVMEETSLAGARRLLRRAAGPVGVLNFASARNPGGGFLGGSQAQEESLARSSALYASLTCDSARPYYDHHRARPSALYSDHMIVSPACPVFRDDAGSLLAEPFHVTFITSAAPNAGALAKKEPSALPQIEPVFHARIRKMLAVAAHAGCRQLVLGAWGCGVFGNDPRMVARLFAHCLSAPSALRGQFEAISFSIRDSTTAQPVLAAFRDALAAA